MRKSNDYLTLILFVLSLLMFNCGGGETQKEERSIQQESKEDQKETSLVLFFGNSLTAGYGIDEEDAYPALIQEKIDSLGLEYDVINGGLSGETTASGLNRLDWFLEEKPSVFVLELGANDGLRGISVNETKKNLKAMVQLVRERYPDTQILLAGMQIPPNMGPEYTESFRYMYEEIAHEEQVGLIPFLLEGVAGDPGLNLPDGIHPTEEGHRIVAETVWEFLLPLL